VERWRRDKLQDEMEIFVFALLAALLIGVIVVIVLLMAVGLE
jgi:hypothetical protein